MRSPRGVFPRTATLILTGAVAVTLGLSGPATAQTLETGPIKVTDSGSITPNGYALKGVTGTGNNAGLFGYGNVNSSAINIDGVVGYVQTQQSVGVVGWAQSTGTSAYGVYGYSATGPGVYGYNNNGGAASIYGSNTSSSGTGVFGNSPSGYGVYGLSANDYGTYGETDSAGTDWAGVWGNDNSSAYNYGVVGTSTYGSGLAAYSYGAETGGDAVYAESYAGDDTIDSYQYGSVFGAANYFYDDAGFVDGYFQAGANAGFALFAASEATGGGTFVAGAYDGVGAAAYGLSGNAADPALMAEEEAYGTYPFATYLNVSGSLGPGPNDETFIVNDTADYSATVVGTQVTQANAEDVQVSGDLYVGGLIFSACSNVIGGPGFPVTGTGGASCALQPGSNVKRTSSGAKLTTYNTTASLPTVEDFGEARLINGQAEVSLEKAFASVIDTKRSYLVFITPEGDSHGLYVSTKTPAGFVVRESMGGHGTLAFQYRIIAHPFGDSSTRLASVAPMHVTTHHSGILRKEDPRSAYMTALRAKSKSMRAAAAHQSVHHIRAPQKSALPLVNPALFTH